MLIKRVPITIKDSLAATSGNDFTRHTNLRNYGHLIRIKAISVCNETNSGTRVNIGYMIGAVAYYFETLVLTNNTYFYISKPDILLNSDYQVVCKFVAPNTGDKYKINIMAEEEVYKDC
jgi:hypothetical protein